MKSAVSEQAQDLRTALGGVLRALREESGKTLSQVADGSGVSVAHLSEVERGRKDISSERLAAIGSALDVPLAQIVAAAARRLGADEPELWPTNPRQRLIRSADALNPQALQTVAEFSAYMATRQPLPRRRIGFEL